MTNVQTEEIDELKLHREAFDIAVAGYSLLTFLATQDVVMRFCYELSESGIALLPRAGRSVPVRGVIRHVIFNAAPGVSAGMAMVEVVYKHIVAATYEATRHYSTRTSQHASVLQW